MTPERPRARPISWCVCTTYVSLGPAAALQTDTRPVDERAHRTNKANVPEAQVLTAGRSVPGGAGRGLLRCALHQQRLLEQVHDALLELRLDVCQRHPLPSQCREERGGSGQLLSQR